MCKAAERFQQQEPLSLPAWCVERGHQGKIRLMEQQHAGIQNEGSMAIREEPRALFDQARQHTHYTGCLHDPSSLLDMGFGAAATFYGLGNFMGLKLLYGVAQSCEELIVVPLTFQPQALQRKRFVLPLDPSTDEIFDKAYRYIEILDGLVARKESLTLLDKIRHLRLR